MDNRLKKAKNIIIWGAQNYCRDMYPKLFPDIRPVCIVPDGKPFDNELFGLTVLNSVGEIKQLESPFVLISRVPASAAKRVADTLRQHDIPFDHIFHYVDNNISLNYLDAMGIYDYVNYFGNRVVFSRDLEKKDCVKIVFKNINNRVPQDNTITLGLLRVETDLEIQVLGSNTSVSLDDNTTIHHAKLRVSTNGTIKVGKNCLFSDDILLDQNENPRIIDRSTGLCISNNNSIQIGDHVCIGKNVHLMGGFSIGNDSVIESFTVSSEHYEESNCMIAGSPSKIIHQNIDWSSKSLEAAPAETHQSSRLDSKCELGTASPSMFGFPFMENIEATDMPSFLQKVDAGRNKLRTPDNDLLNSIPQVFELNKLQTLPNGRIDIIHKDITFECFFHHKPDRPLYVFLNGAMTSRPPEFKRWSWYKFLDGSMLNIADPMYRRFPDLSLGWYYGEKDISYRHYVAELVEKVAELLGLDHSQIIFYGSSGGGAALIQCAALIKGSTAVAINPQIRLSEFNTVNYFKRMTGNDLTAEDPLHRNDLSWFLKNEKDTHFILLQNLRSKEDMQQQKNIAELLDMPLKYGISRKDNVLLWTYDAPSLVPHNAQEFYPLYFPIKYLIEHIRDNDLSDSEPFFRWVNEMWYERSRNVNILEREKRRVTLIQPQPDLQDSVVSSLEELVLPDKKNTYNFSVIHGKLLPKKLYSLTWKDSELLSGNTDYFQVGIMDPLQTSCLLKKYSIGKPGSYLFVTPVDCSKLDLRAYAGEVRSNATDSIKLIGLKLEIVSSMEEKG